MTESKLNERGHVGAECNNDIATQRLVSIVREHKQLSRHTSS